MNSDKLTLATIANIATPAIDHKSIDDLADALALIWVVGDDDAVAKIIKKAIITGMQMAQATITELESRLHHLGETANKQAAEIEQLKAAMKELPVTRDGVRVIPGNTNTKLYNPDYYGTKRFEVDASYIEWDGSMWFVGWGGPDYDASPLSEWFADRENICRFAAKGEGIMNNELLRVSCAEGNYTENQSQAKSCLS